MAALKRSALVLVTGNGFAMPSLMLLPLLQAAMGWVLYRRTGTTLWDRAAGSQLVHAQPGAPGFIFAGALMLGWGALCLWIILTAPLPVNAPAEQRQEVETLRQQLEQNRRLLESRKTPVES